MSRTLQEPGKIILLNGASSSGKSTLARQLQARLETPFLILSSDQLVDGGALPPQRSTGHDPLDPFSWTAVIRPKFFSGFHGSIRAMALAGNNLVVDHIVEYPEWVRELQELLSDLEVWTIGVHCDMDELERRERERGDRRVGEGRAHVEENRIHELIEYDFELDTTTTVTSEQIDKALLAWASRGAGSARLRTARRIS